MLINPLLKQLPKTSKEYLFKQRNKHFEIVICPFCTQDAQEIYSTVETSFEHLKRFILQNQEIRLEQIQQGTKQAEFDWDNGKNYYFSVKNKLTKQIVGNVLLSEVNQVHRYAKFGCWFSKDVLGTKISILSCLDVLLRGFELGLMRIEMVIDINNKASLNAIKRLPVHYECLMRNRLSIANECFDAHMFAITPSDIPTIHQWINDIIA